MDKFEAALPRLKESLGRASPVDFARAIMTTDTFPKTASRTVDAGGEVRVLGVAKGAGMISPDMATMLGFVLTDAEISAEDWRQIIKIAADSSFNRITVDGDTSTNDCVMGLANGASGVRPEGRLLDRAAAAVVEVCRDLAYMIVQDAEGGTKVARIKVFGARDARDAELAARAVGNSPLVKTALFGRDPNWGRIAAALGRSGAAFDPADTSISLAGVEIFKAGLPAVDDVDAATAGKLDGRDVDIEISLGSGGGEYVLLAGDLTHEYVSINADYRT
jgi:glutamate N-acetyltransferase/amino-acid N-acetyltransferase